MGHERLGLLPKTRKWREIVRQIEETSTGSSISELVSATADCIDDRFRSLCLDKATRDVFTTLIQLTVVAKQDSAKLSNANQAPDLPNNPTPLNLAKYLDQKVKAQFGKDEYAHLAKASAVEAITRFYVEKNQQTDLFDTENSFDVWRQASNGSGFCELARQFFASLTKNYFAYFLEREASAALPNLKAREEFQRNLEDHFDDMSRHSFETSKITQSFAAGWYNRHVGVETPDEKTIRAFLRVAFNKVRDSLSREGAA